MDKTYYVVGFYFSDNRVVLIRKSRPDWQAGKLNGVGGKVELSDQSARHAMAREFLEETGKQTGADDWNYVCGLQGDGFYVAFYYMWGDGSDIETKTEEEVIFLPISQLANAEVIPNVRWLVPMAMNKAFGVDRAIFDIHESSYA